MRCERRPVERQRRDQKVMSCVCLLFFAQILACFVRKAGHVSRGHAVITVCSLRYRIVGSFVNFFQQIHSVPSDASIPATLQVRNSNCPPQYSYFKLHPTLAEGSQFPTINEVQIERTMVPKVTCSTILYLHDGRECRPLHSFTFSSVLLRWTTNLVVVCILLKPRFRTQEDWQDAFYPSYRTYMREIPVIPFLKKVVQVTECCVCRTPSCRMQGLP